MKINCWELKKCGREPGGSNCTEKGECPAAGSSSFDGLNHGKNGGRICWTVAGTFCDGIIQGMFAMKIDSCLKCDFFKLVAEEEDADLGMFKDDELPTEETATEKKNS